MKFKYLLSVMVLSMIVSAISATAMSSVFDEGWKNQIGKKVGLAKYDYLCDKGMIWGRMSAGYQTCVWSGNNKVMNNDIFKSNNVDSNNNNGSLVDDYEDSFVPDGEEGSSNENREDTTLSKETEESCQEKE